jgi:hypothetical protein
MRDSFADKVKSLRKEAVVVRLIWWCGLWDHLFGPKVLAFYFGVLPTFFDA